MSSAVIAILVDGFERAREKELHDTRAKAKAPPPGIGVGSALLKLAANGVQNLLARIRIADKDEVEDAIDDEDSDDEPSKPPDTKDAKVASVDAQAIDGSRSLPMSRGGGTPFTEATPTPRIVMRTAGKDKALRGVRDLTIVGRESFGLSCTIIPHARLYLAGSRAHSRFSASGQ